MKSFLKPIMFQGVPQGLDDITQLRQMVKKNQLIAAAQTTMASKVKEVVQGIVSGNIAIFG
ncbi:hypothetical protein GCM10020331_013610 [Ectobacillus funiculus]